MPCRGQPTPIPCRYLGSSPVSAQHFQLLLKPRLAISVLYSPAIVPPFERETFLHTAYTLRDEAMFYTAAGES